MAGNLFLNIEGVTGECVETSHVGWIDLFSWQEGLASASSASYGGGGGLGTVQYSDMSFQCQLEKAIPNLMVGCADHKPYPTVKLHATKMGGDGKSWTYLEIILNDALVTNVHMNGTQNDIPTVTVTMAFTKIKTEYWVQTETGGKGASTTAGWNAKENKKF
jgi:type VI secretion system secreted protein Hcp